MSWRSAFLERKILTLIMVSSLIALQLSALIIIAHQWRSHRRLLVREMGGLALIIAETTAEPAPNRSMRRVQRTLSSLRHDRRIVGAEVEIDQGGVLAKYGREGVMPYDFDAELAKGEHFDRTGLTLIQPILHQGELVGTLRLRADFASVNEELASTALAILAAMVFGVVLVLVFARRFTRILSRPLVELHELARTVSESSDYSLRAQRRSDDELGALTDAFNEMLHEIEDRDEDLQAAHGELHDWVVELKLSQDRERELTERLNRSEKMESLGLLAGGVAHDLNNILGPIVGYPDLILESLDESSSMHRHLRLIRDSAIRAAVIIQDLLTLARRGSYSVQPISLSRVTRRYLESPEFETSCSEFENIQLDVCLAPDESMVEASAPHLSQVVMNLILNAIEAMPDGGALRVRTYETALNEAIVGFERIPAGRYGVLAVSDNGSGIHEDDLGRVFEPFFSNKQLGHSGSGLGLAVVWGVIKDLSGYIDVKTTAGEGSTFKIYLPAVEVGDETETAMTVAELFGEETVLVVDDEAVQRDLAQALLESLGYKVFTCDSGRAAVAYLETNDVDLVILDMIMEEDFDGLRTHRQILSRKPGQRCVIASGFSDSARVNEALALGAVCYVAKPYTREEIGTAIRVALNPEKAVLS